MFMATRLAGKATTFLPFNRGRGTGAGNPDNPTGYRTAYLWEQVWAKDNWLDILARFIHIEKTDKGKDKGDHLPQVSPVGCGDQGGGRCSIPWCG